MHKPLFLIFLATLLSGCALKQYPSSLPVSPVQSTQLDCNGVTAAIATQRRLQDEIDRTGQFDALTVLGFLGDFGIGNGVAKHRAQTQAAQRMTQLKALEKAKCPPLA